MYIYNMQHRCTYTYRYVYKYMTDVYHGLIEFLFTHEDLSIGFIYEKFKYTEVIRNYLFTSKL